MSNSKIFTKIIFPALFLLAISLFAMVAKSPNKSADSADLFFLDVGQGDAELIQKDNFQILIDGGPDDSLVQELPKYMPLGDKKIEVMILSHPHADHLTGINELFGKYEIGKIYFSGVSDTTNQYLKFLNEVKERKIDASVPEIGEEILPFNFSRLTFLWPGKEFQGKDTDNLNNTSLITKFCYYDSCSIFLGDAENEELDAAQDYFRERNNLDIFKSGIVKVPHHGSTNALDENMYKLILPRHAVIEVGKDNRYGHPHQKILDYLYSLGLTISRTDREGTIKFDLSKN